MSIYTPPGCRPLSDVTDKQQLRFGIQGFGGTGKTWSCLGTSDGKQLGFPNPIVLNMDRGISAFVGRKDIIEIPFWKPEIGGKPEEQKDKMTTWLEREGTKLGSEQTLVVDSLSKLDQIYHKWFTANATQLAISSKGTYNDFVEWQIKTRWFNEIHLIMSTLKCDIILLCHESDRPDKPTTVGQPGTYTGKIRPILSGQFGDTIIKEYTDWFRQHCCAKTSDPQEQTLTRFRMTKAEFIAMQQSFIGDTVYFWQTRGDDLFNAKASSLINPPTFIPATYESFVKYMRKP